MGKSELLCVQEPAVETANACAESRVLNRIITPGAVSFITYDRMLQPREMHSDLMCSSGFKLHIEKRETIEPFPHAVERQRIAPAAHNSHARPVPRITRQRLIDLSGICLHSPMHQRHVRLEHGSIPKLI